jgi:hypothetical protein
MADNGTFVAAQAAELGDVRGRGYLAIRTDGYRRCEGTFFCGKARADSIKGLLRSEEPVRVRAIVYNGGSDLGLQTIHAVVRAFRSQPEGLVVHVQAVGAWWETIADG